MPFITQGKTNLKYILIVVVLAAIVGGGVLGYFYFWLPGQEIKPPEVIVLPEEVSPPEEVAPEEEKIEEKPFTYIEEVRVKEIFDGSTIEIDTPVIYTVDCGSKNCFNEKFGLCEKAIMTAEIPFPSSSMSHEIVALTGEGCIVKSKYLSNPNPEFINKDLICIYSEKEDFEKAFREAFEGVIKGTRECQGPLVDVLRSL